MKWFDPPKTIEAMKKRAQVSLLMLNIIIAGVNLIILTTKLETLGQKTIFFCQMNSMTTSVCVEQ